MSESTPECPVQGCSLSIDVIIKSSDGRLIGAHSENLAAHSGGFPPACFASPESTLDPVELTEKSEVIEMMLKYMHNDRLASLDELSAAQVEDIAYAAEKYLIYSLMEVCRLHIKFRFMKDLPKMVLSYAVKHGYDDLFDETVRHTVDWNVNDAYSAMGATSYFVAWVRYRESWLQLREEFIVGPPVVLHKGGVSECPLWSQFIVSLLKLKISKLAIRKLYMGSFKTEILGDCSWCSQRADLWMRSINDPPVIPKASSLK